MSKVLKLFSKNKRTIFFIVGLGLVLSFLPYSFIEADPVIPGPPGSPFTPPSGNYDLCELCGPWPHEWPNCFACIIGYLASLPVRFMFAALVVIFGIGSLIAGIFYALVAALITWLVGVIMSVGIVPGADNTPDIVTMGWNFSRQFANLFFILALAFIGLATILRIKEYEAKKALPTLIIIALLINFTPVIVGFVVDMGNIVTKFFLDAAGNIRNMLDILETARDYIFYATAHVFLRDGAWWTDFFSIAGEFIGIVIYGLVLFIFFNLAMFIYLLIGAVFFCRTVILWILMIISPIAFLSKAFPATRTTKMVFPDILHWDKWWEKLIQWTIIGIPIGFFLYLSNSIMTSDVSIGLIFNSAELESELATTTAYASSTFLVPLGDQFVSLFTSLLAPVVGLVFLAMGMLISFKAAPEGAKGIMQFASEKGIRRGWQGIRAGYAAISRAPQTYRAERLNKRWDQAIGPTIKQTFSTTGKEMRSAWASAWGRRQPSQSTPPAGGDAPAAPNAPAAGGGAPATISHAKEIGDEEESSTEEIVATTPPAPPTPGRRERAGRAALGAVKWVFPTPKRLLKRQGRAFKFGGHVAAGILRTTESIAKQEIDKRMKIGEESKKGGKAKKMINCPLCLKEIPADSEFCQHCGEKLE